MKMEDNSIIEKLRDENKRLNSYIDNMNAYAREKEKHASRVFWICLLTSTFAGFLIATGTAPLPKSNNDCNVFKINNKPVTAFVLKPPPAPPEEHPVCPVAPKCEAQVTPEPENVSKAEVSNADDTKPRRHRRHHRVRTYWR
jgi:hypothetical protein